MTRYKIQFAARSELTGVEHITDETEVECETDEQAIDELRKVQDQAPEGSVRRLVTKFESSDEMGETWSEVLNEAL